jgi:hypothetical protein
LDLSSHKGYTLEFWVRNIHTGSQHLRCELNEITTNASYYARKWGDDHSGTWAAPYLYTTLTPNDYLHGKFDISMGFTSRIIMRGFIEYIPSALTTIGSMNNWSMLYVDDITNLTSFKLLFPVATTIGSGSWARLYRKY